MPLGWFLSGCITGTSTNFLAWFRYLSNFKGLRFKSKKCLFRLSKNLRTQPNFKRRFAWHLSKLLVVTSFLWAYSMLGTAFVKIPSDYQWILAFLTPFLGEIGCMVLFKINCKAAGEQLEGNQERTIDCLTQHYIGARHAVFMGVIVGGVATQTTNYCIAAMDFVLAIYDCLKIIRKHRKNEDILDDVEDLVMSERQSLIGLIYLLLILMSYFGPNADLLGNIKMSIWHFQSPIGDIQVFIYNVVFWMAVDLFSALISGMLLWYFCKANVLKSMFKLQKQFWLQFAIVEAFVMTEVSSR